MVRDEYALLEVDRWPIRSLSVYCFVYRVPSGEDRESLIDRLKFDARIESVQALHEFETGTNANASYDDTYANLQHGLSRFETATSSQDSALMDYVLSIQFESGTSPADRDRILQDIGARDVSGGSDEGSYRVIVQLSAASLEELDSYTGDLESLSEVRSVAVVALQLPLRSQ